MKNILIPTDFSDNANNAIQYALELFSDKECVFYLVNTYIPVIPNGRFLAASVGGSSAENTATESLNGLKETVSKFEMKFENTKHSFQTISSFSLIVDEIKEVLEANEIDLIVMGTQGASGLQEVFMGTQTVRVIKAISNCPILVIPESVIYAKVTDIAFATDYKKNYDAEMLNPLRILASQFKANIHIAHINEEKVLNTSQEANKNVLSEYLHSLKHSYYWVPSFASKTEVLNQFVEDVQVNMLAMVNFEHSPLMQLMRESVIKKMAFHTQIPLLVLPEYGYNEGNS